MIEQPHCANTLQYNWVAKKEIATKTKEIQTQKASKRVCVPIFVKYVF